MRSLRPDSAAYTLSVFVLGFALGPLLFGALSDRLGRRPVLLAGCAAFAGFGAVAAFARSIDALLLCRLLMGVGAGTVQALVVATVRDLYAGAEARVRHSYVNLAAGLAPVIAPTLGILTAAVGGWRLIYAVLAAGGIALPLAVALAGAVVAALFDGHASLAITAPMTACALASVAVYVAIVRRAEQAATRSAGRSADRGSDVRFGLISTQHQ